MGLGTGVDNVTAVPHTFEDDGVDHTLCSLFAQFLQDNKEEQQIIIKTTSSEKIKLHSKFRCPFTISHTKRSGFSPKVFLRPV